MKKISIDPITRLEGHGSIELFLNDDGTVAHAYLQIPELRGFEQFCVGRQAEEMPILTARICGVCPEAHSMAAAKTLDQLFGVDPPATAKKIRELLYSSFFVTDHTTHFYALGGPDFVVGPDAPSSERNIFGVIRKVGMDLGKQVIACRKRNHDLIQQIGGRGIHMPAAVVGGWSKTITKEEQHQAEAIAKENIAFAQLSLDVFRKMVLENPTYKTLITSDLYYHETYSMGTVDSNNQLNFYDGTIRVMDPKGNERLHYEPKEYQNHIAERVESYSYLKFPYLKDIGWKDFTDGMASGIYTATPLSRLNATDGMPTPLAQEAYEEMYTTFNKKQVDGHYEPIHHRLATHWARLIELLYASERMLELAQDPELTNPNVRVIPTKIVREGIGSVEAPRGTLTHHYVSDSNALLTHVNLIVGTTNNHAPISMSIKKAAEQLIKPGEPVTDAILNQIEMAFRPYDPCFGCATHAYTSTPSVSLNIRDCQGQLIQAIYPSDQQRQSKGVTR
jgi:F420-non-reducing hydrogenase large subunit